jgi:transcriptional regulator with XRE-family HTH domain
MVRRVRLHSGLSQRELAERVGLSASTIAAYETGRATPRVDTLDRILAAAGFTATITLTRRAGDAERGRELEEALELAAQFPARHSPSLEFPIFGRNP